MVYAWLQRHPRIVVGVLVLVALGSALAHRGSQHDRALLVVLALVQCLPLWWVRRAPVPVLALVTAATTVIVLGWSVNNPLPVGIALFVVASRLERRDSVRAGAVAIAVLAVPVLHSVGWHPAPFAGHLLGFVVAWLLGDSLGTGRRYVHALEERAERLERERQAEARRAAAEEQARIARELHDVIAHSVSVMVVQAAAANDVFDAHPEQARGALQSIETAGREALAELRALLGVVREDYAPQPGLARLDELVDRVRSAGLSVAVTIEGEPRPLPVGIELSAYRVVQEALTNTLKHAAASRADVELRFGDDELGLVVRDDGVGVAENGSGGGGNGLIGMRERVGLFGGRLEAGPRPGGGFVVSARFPLAAAP